MNRSETLTELAPAFAKAQSQMRHAEKDAVNPAFKSKYATLASVIDAVRQPLADNGLAFTQVTVETETGVGIETVLLHSSGQWISSLTIMPAGKATPHGVAAAFTYAKRYGLASLLGISAETDDDGNVATKSAAPRRSTSVAQTVVEETKAQVDDSRLLDVIIALRESIDDDDGLGIQQVWQELDNDTKTVVWTRLESGERSRITEAVRAGKK